MRYLCATIAIVFACIATPAVAEISCETIKNAIASLPREKLLELKAQATPEQIAFGRKCLQGSNPAKGEKVAKKGPKRVKKHQKHIVQKVVPLPRPAPEKVQVPLPPVKEAISEQQMLVTPAVEKPPMETLKVALGWTEVFAIFGLFAFTYFVGKFGFMPVIAKIKDRAAAAQDAERAFWSRITRLESEVDALKAANAAKATPAPVAPPAPAAPAS